MIGVRSFSWEWVSNTEDLVDSWVLAYDPDSYQGFPTGILKFIKYPSDKGKFKPLKVSRLNEIMSARDNGSITFKSNDIIYYLFVSLKSDCYKMPCTDCCIVNRIFMSTDKEYPIPKDSEKICNLKIPEQHVNLNKSTKNFLSLWDVTGSNNFAYGDYHLGLEIIESDFGTNTEIMLARAT